MSRRQLATSEDTGPGRHAPRRHGPGRLRLLRVTSSADYALRAATVLARAEPGRWVKGDEVARNQRISFRYSEQLLATMRRAGLVESQRGLQGGYRLARPPAQITLAEVIRVVDGPLGDMRGHPPEDIDYPPPATAVRDIWVATRAALRAVLEHVDLAQLASGDLPPVVTDLLAGEGAWQRRPPPGT